MVIDGHSLAFRAFFALPTDSFVNSEGQHTNGIHGFISMLLSLLRDHNPSHIAVAFDAGAKSFRNREYEDYKGGRDETPPEFKGQIELLQESLTAMGITWMQKDDYEADDILATLAAEGERDGYDVLVVSGDRDAIQLVNDETTLLYPSVQGVSKLTHYTPETVHEKYGVYPQQYPDLAAMVGEKADNLPGIPKVGPKTAAKWIDKYGSLDGVLEHEDELTGKVGESFRENRENAIRNRKLNRLLTDVDLPYEPDDLTIRPIDVDAVRDVFTRLQFRTLQDRVLKLASERDGAVVTTDTSSVLDDVKILDSLAGGDLKSWLDQAVVDAPEGLGLSLQFVEGEFSEAGVASKSEAVRVVAGDDAQPFLDWLAGETPKITFEGKELYKQAMRAGVGFGGEILDGKLAAFLVNPTGVPKRLSELVQQYLGETLPEADPNQLVSLEDEQTNFTASDAWFTKRATEAASGRLPDVTKPVFSDIETPLLRILGDMEHTGIATDRDLLKELSTAQGEQIAKYETEAFDAVGGERFNLGSPKQLQTVLFDQLDMPKTRRTKTGYSTDAQALEELEQKNPHPFLGALRHHRDATKLKQIMDSLIKAITPDERIHTTYQQTAAATGRLASTDPNLQNIPIRSPEGQRIREAFVTHGDYVELLTADYSQIEMRIMAHLSGDESLIDAFNRHEDTHRFVGSQVFGVEPEDVTPEMRTKVKAMSYGLVYGLSAFGLSKQLGISQGEAKDLMTQYFERFGKVRDYLRDSVARAKEDGYTETIFGRRRPFPDLNSTNRVARQNAERAALNAPIQGSAADIIKLAMIKVDDRMREAEMRSRMLLQVHDELVFEVVDGEFDDLETLVRDAMANAADLSVPLDVSVGRGANWQTAGH
ncbi:DNA polymerase I [Gulosibacter molinativorax]|uniref:DNA polymerase I n=1 Tax=Gulosibacter molinativorax TaxID=256821 RepID=A0ABT7C7B2_9MICO|nr:DNA polymerase I [Gulosibacter molinativorax]MDJ1371095.1 DNA polymerase I [Gulosibacter molinativorax]